LRRAAPFNSARSASHLKGTHVDKPKKKRSEVEEMIFEQLKPRHPALEMVRLHHDGETGWRCNFVWKIEGNVPVDDIDTLRNEADSELARLRNNFEILEG
jgi:hypothetical protein